MPSPQPLAYTLWNPEQNTITFVANQGQGTMESVSLARHEACFLPKARFARHNHSFRGWSTEPDGSGLTYLDGEEFTMGDANVVLFAQWRVIHRGLLAMARPPVGQTRL